MATRKKATRRTAKRTSEKRVRDKFDILDVGHKVWLAGLGALSRAQTEGPKAFENLVEEGAVVHERVRDTTEQVFNRAIGEVRGMADQRISSLRGRVDETWDDVEKIFQSRVQSALRQIGVPTSREIRALTRKVEELTRSVESLGAKQKRAGGRRAHSSNEAGQRAAT